MAFVIRSWHANNHADNKGRYVSIEGRQAGLIPWFLALIGIDPTVRMSVYSDKFTFELGSISGMNRRIIPLAKISSTFYGYSKPWKEAFALCLTSVGLGIAISGIEGFFAFILLFAISLAYYVLNKELALAVVEDSGFSSTIEFKRSVIENQSIDENQAEKVVMIINALVERRLNADQTREILESGLGKACSNCNEIMANDGNYCETCGSQSV